ncbi:MAG: hypothetical protein KF724_03845 [Phycisphaeraceae bacterium]|nr:hypothetical protein [Phycisphaeraceae bacterium]
MRIDHLAYQQATRVAGFGLLLQLAIGLLLLILGQVLGDTALVGASWYVLPGIAVWVTLIVVFNQHRLERLEALERLEIEAARREGRGVFDQESVVSDAAARRLGLVHKFMVPGVTLLVAGLWLGLGIYALNLYAELDRPGSEADAFRVGSHQGWQLAIAVGLALVSFIFSRFVAGMAKQTAWQNLRGGAGVMVGTALVLLALAVGIVFHVFQQPRAAEVVARCIAWFMVLVAAEALLNFILNLYRPRRPGEYPRPAFDSRVLGLLAAPDNIVRSINEAINYQFGFDITSSWGYQLMLRSFAALLALGTVVLVLLSMVVVVGPGQQAVRLRGGRIVGEVQQATVLIKWPWPLETAHVVDVSQLRTLELGPKPKPIDGRAVNLWAADASPDPSRQAFLVAAPSLAAERQRDLGPGSEAAAALGGAAALPQVPPSPMTAATPVRGAGRPGQASASPEEQALEDAARGFALVDADVMMSYRIKSDGLLDWLNFANDVRVRRSELDMRERALRAIAMRELSQFLSTQPLDEVLSPRGESLGTALQARIQSAFDRERAGVEVVAVITTMLKPPGEAGEMFESISVETQNARKTLEEARQVVDNTMATLIGDASQATMIVNEILAWQALRNEKGHDDPAVIEGRARLERLLTANPAQAARELAFSASRRWSSQIAVRRSAMEVLGQVESYLAAPELYRQRKTMEVIGQVLAGVRTKFVFGVDPERVQLDLSMQTPDSALNLRDYLERKD